MDQTSRNTFVIVLCTAFSLLWLCGNVYAAPTVRITMRPRRIDEYGSPQQISFTAHARGISLHYAWTLDGPGLFEGPTNAPEVTYLPPEHIDEESFSVTIRITVRDDIGQQSTDHVSFMLLPPLLKTGNSRPTLTLTVSSKGNSRQEPDVVSSDMPVLSHVTVNPQQVNPGAMNIFAIDFVDVSGDLNGGMTVVTDSQGNSYQGLISNAAGTSGTLTTAINLSPLLMAGEMLFDIFVVDLAGNVSNTVFAGVEVW